MIDQYRKDILYLLQQHQVLVVVGETGSGKSTILPQILYKAGIFNKENDSYNSDTKSVINYKHKLIGITQPRRVAAVQLARRVASDLKYPLGTVVGYTVRFQNESNPDHTQIKYLTEGILVREMMSDPLVGQYSVIIVDEAHERNIITDVLLGLLKCILLKRTDLKLIICSATLDINTFVDFFTYKQHSSDIPSRTPAVLAIRGRSYPLTIFYKRDPVPNYLDAAVETIVRIHESSSLNTGKILAFLTGQDEVEYVCNRLTEYTISSSKIDNVKKLLVLPLYASLKPEQISRVFDEHGRDTRVCIIATNVAETSLTIDNVAHVIDCGFTKLNIFDLKTRTETLVRVPISQSSANQRAGRAGRTRAGCVYRLYPETEYSKLARNTIPEIQRHSLTEVVMLLKSLGVVDVQKFPLISSMPRNILAASLEILYVLQAIDANGRLTDAGKIMVRLNLDPKIAKFLVSPYSRGCVREVCRIAAMLQVQEIFNKPPGYTSLILWTNSNLTNLCACEGDLLSYLNILEGFINSKMNPKWAERRFLNAQALTNALDIATKLERQLEKNGISPTSAAGRTELVQKAIVSGLFSNAAYLHPSGNYKTIRGDQPVHIHPTSVINELMDDRPKYVIFAQLLNTTKPYMRHLMTVEQEWLLEAAPHYYRFGTETRQASRRVAPR